MSPFIGLRSKRDKSVYVWLWGGYLLYNAMFEEISKSSPSFPSQRGNSPSAILFILTAVAAITPHTKSYEIVAVTTHFFVCKIQLF